MALQISVYDLRYEERDILTAALDMGGVLIASPDSPRGEIVRRLAGDGVFFRTEDRISSYRLTREGRVLAEQVAAK